MMRFRAIQCEVQCYQTNSSVFVTVFTLEATLSMIRFRAVHSSPDLFPPAHASFQVLLYALPEVSIFGRDKWGHLNGVLPRRR